MENIRLRPSVLQRLGFQGLQMEMQQDCLPITAGQFADCSTSLPRFAFEILYSCPKQEPWLVILSRLCAPEEVLLVPEFKPDHIHTEADPFTPLPAPLSRADSSLVGTMNGPCRRILAERHSRLDQSCNGTLTRARRAGNRSGTNSGTSYSVQRHLLR